MEHDAADDDERTNGIFDTGWSTTKTASHSFATVEQHTIRLEVQDTGDLTAATTRQVMVHDKSHQVFLPLVVRQ